VLSHQDSPGKNFTSSFSLVYFHTALLKADQTTWTVSHCYNSCSFEVVLPETSTDQEWEKKHEEEESPAHRLDRTGNGNPSPSVSQQKQTMEQHQIYAVLAFFVFTLVSKSNCFFIRSCPIWAAGKGVSYPACCSVHERNAAVTKKMVESERQWLPVVTQTRSEVRHFLSLAHWIVRLHFPCELRLRFWGGPEVSGLETYSGDTAHSYYLSNDS